jgi:uncharacterized protein YkwD
MAARRRTGRGLAIGAAFVLVAFGTGAIYVAAHGGLAGQAQPGYPAQALAAGACTAPDADAIASTLSPALTTSPGCARRPAAAAGGQHAASGRPAGSHEPAARQEKRHAPRPGHPAKPRPPHPASPAASAATSSPPPPPAPSPPAAPPGAASGSAAAQVLALINQARAQAGRPAYTITAGLDLSSAGHNQKMAGGCGLSHQCPGEPSLGARETAAGVSWTSAGENIGEGGPEPDTAAAMAQMAVNLTQDMLNEKPPDDGHRLNILSSAFHHVGITVGEDSSGTVWMTQDFSN